jgi:CHAT domain
VVAGTGGDPGSRLDEVAALLDQLPQDDPAVPQLVAEAVQLLFANGPSRSALRSEQSVTLLERWAARLPADHPAAPVARFLGLAARYVQALLAGDTERADAALTDLLGSVDLVPPGHPSLPFAYGGLASAYFERHALHGGLRDLEQAKDMATRGLEIVEKSSGQFGAGTQLHGFLLYVHGHMLLAWNVYDRHWDKVGEAIAEMERSVTLLGPEMAARLEVGPALDTARIMLEQLTAPSGPGRPLGPETSTAFDGLASSAAAMRPDQMGSPVVAAQAAAGLAMRALSSGNEAFINQAIAQLAAAAATPGLGLRERPRLLELHGFALQTRHHMTRDPRDLSNAISLLEGARRAVEQELGSPFASSILLTLASAYRTRGNEALGDTERAVHIGLAGLREHAGDVLLQDSDDNALHMARRGSDDAAEMARWFLSRSRHDAAVAAIELGRGMVLSAATSGDGVAAALAASGHPDLAAAWGQRAAGTRPPDRLVPASGGEADDDLRYRAMRALEATPAEAALLSPPTLDEIADALTRTGTDLLAYLLPQDENGGGMATGMALLIDRTGTVRWIPLARLRAGKGTVVDDFVRARQAAETAADDNAQQLRQHWRDTLGRACDWAWGAVIGPLLSAAQRAATHGQGGLPLRIALVPAGPLGLIPWHAARRPADGTLPHYACQDAVFTYASSARQFVEASGRRPRPWPERPVLISDNDQELTYAALEVAHLATRYYRGGALYGAARAHLDAQFPGADAASPGVVLAALPHGPAPGASLLHVSCHGRVTLPVLAANLRIGTVPGSGGDGGTDIAVSVRDILRQARQAPPGAGAPSGGLVVLGACLTDVTEADYDEALTLATAFLAAGSTGVVAARWAVSDRVSAVFMAAFHRFLNAGSGDAASALRETQLWMLDPARQTPADCPPRLRRAASMAEAESWAAFTYQGR